MKNVAFESKTPHFQLSYTYIFCRRLDIAFRNTKATRTRTNSLGWIWYEDQPEQFILAQRYNQDERIRLAKMLDQSARMERSCNCNCDPGPSWMDVFSLVWLKPLLQNTIALDKLFSIIYTWKQSLIVVIDATAIQDYRPEDVLSSLIRIE
ncbi:unnamed protein product [Albugo candida]|uniref:Uncharacterized protein n=1 Tax=Albugo candida TaxID=65357 RepID=A0A024GSE4_9STRA|nr:unnamed protein product [Albugo candida]|eukprot:CCI49839.1 unnamed protein product [Albugo candida]